MTTVLAILLILGAVFAWVLARDRAAVRRSEERYSRAVQASNDGIWEWSPLTDEIFLSGRARQLYAVPDGAVVRTRSELMRVGGFHPDDRPGIDATVDSIQARCHAGDTGFDMEYRIIDRGGMLRWVRSQGKAFPGRDGRVALVTGALTDITERKRIEEALRESEKRYERVMLASEAGFFDWNVATDEYYVSPAMLEQNDFPPDTRFSSREEFLRRTPFVPEDREAYQRAARELFASGGSRMSMEVRQSIGGRTRWFNIAGICFRDPAGKVVRWTGSSTEITDRKRAELSLRQSEQRYALAMEAAADGHMDWDFATGEFYISPRMKQIVGHPPDAVYADRADWVRSFPFHADDRKRWEEAVAAHFAGQEAIFKSDFRIVVKGETRWLAFNFIATRDAAGKVVRWTGSITDINDAKRDVASVVESIPGLVAILTPAGELEAVSDQLAEYCGQPVEVLKHWGTNGTVHPEDVPRGAETFMRGISTGQPYEFEARVRRFDGAYRWNRIRGEPHRDTSGRIVRWYSTLSDLDDRKRAEEALRESQDLFARAVAGSADGIWDIDLVARSVYFSPRTRELCGLHPGPEVVPLDGWFEALPLHPEDLPRRFAAVQAHLSGEAPAYDGEFRFLQPDGVYRWRHLHGVCVRDAGGKPLRMAGSISDIDARRRAEDALRLSEERYALAMRASGEGHWDWNIVTDELYASPRYLELGGFAPDAQPQRADVLKQLFHPDDRARYETAVAAHFAGETPRVDMVVRILPQGQERWLQLIGMCSRDAEGQPVRWVGSVTDITARMLAEKALRESEKRYERAMLAAEAGFWDWDVPADRFHVSAKLLEMTGLPPETMFANRADFTARASFHPDDRELWERAVRDLLASGGERLAREIRTIVGGETRWHLLSGLVIRDADGKVLRWTGSATDITERKRAEQELRESEARFRGLTTTWSDWYWEQDENLRYTFTSGATDPPPPGYPGGQAVGRKRWELDGIVPVSSTWEEHRALLEARKAFRDFEYSRPMKDGTLTYISTSGTPIFDEQGRFRGYHGTGRNITARKLAEEALRESEKRYERAMAASRAGYWDWDLAKGEYYLSPAMLELAGFPPGTTFTGREDFVRRSGFYTPQERDDYLEAVRQLLASDGTRLAQEVRLLVEGKIRWINMEGMCVRDAAGKVSRWTGFATDVTKRKEAEQDLRRMEERLRLAQRLEGIGTLAGGIAHDFNNILGAIVGYGEMALRGVKDGTRQRRDLEAIMAAGERGRALVDRILAFSRSGVGERVPVHVESVVREALDQVAAKLPESVTLQPRLHAGRAAMLGDSTQVHQVVMNLAWNAVQAMPRGGMLRVDLGTERFDTERPAMVGSIAAGEYIVLGVSDTGTGIAPEVLERMFDPFFTTKEVGVGSGLGLSLVHGIVTSAGGAIEVTTEPGKGSTFTVSLPRTGDAAEAPADEDGPLPRGCGQRVLVVDDEEALVRLAGDTLEYLGYAPVTFTSSTRALQAFDANPGDFDAILTDERMPGVSGSSLIREVRRIKPSIPIVLMSGFVGTLDPREQGADDVLRKPLLARDLATSLARVLDVR